MTLAAVVSAFLLTLGPQGPLQTSDPAGQAADQSPAVNLGVVESLGSRRAREREAEAFVAKVAKAPEGASLARWQDEVCVGVANLASPYAQFVADRVSAVASDLGLRIGEPGCKANIMIMFASDADDAARGLIAVDRPSFLPATNRTTLGAGSLEAFENSDQPVRWWQISLEVELDTGTPPVLTRVFVSGGEIEVPVLRVRQMSHLGSGLRADLQRVIIIVDVNRIGGANLASIADYVSFVAMAQVNPEADASGQNSILTLFSDHPMTDRLTEWDVNYLRSLYGATRDRQFVGQQAREIARSMAARQVNGEVRP